MIDDPYYSVRLSLVEQINRDRIESGLGPVELDVLSSQVGDRHCQEMAANGFLSHWNLRGLKPYHRYHLAGGRDHVQENLSRLTVITNNPIPILTQPQDVLPHMLRAHKSMFEEKPPLDGHRKNILDPAHTHVGVGFAVVEKEFTLSQQFLNRFIRLNELPAELPRGSIRVEGEMLRKEYGPYYCVLFHDGEPKPWTVEDLNKTYAYSDVSGEICAKVPPWEMRFSRSRGRFSFSFRASNCGPGYYHLLLWVRDDVGSIPYQLYQGGSFAVNTKDATPCAGWLFHK